MINSLLEIPIDNLSKSDILEKILKYIEQRESDRASSSKALHIASVNPEIVVAAQQNAPFKKALQKAQIHIIDGTGVYLACRVLGVPVHERIAGVDLMTDMIKMAHESRLRVLLIGGNGKVAEKVAECQKKIFPGVSFSAIEGIANISKPAKQEEERVFSIVADVKPHLIFVSFGSPSQELWIDSHIERFDNIIVMGVGGAFDFLSGNITRAPLYIRNIGLEWLYRLIQQPWRLRRQTKLLQFIWLVAKAKIASYSLSS